jgi:hypothetical protein
LPHDHPDRFVLAHRLAHFSHFSSIDEATLARVSVRLIANAVVRSPWHGHLSADCRSLDDSHHKVIVLDAAISDCKEGLSSTVELVGNGYALPIVDGFLKDILILLKEVAPYE